MAPSEITENWGDMVGRIRQGDALGGEHLYRTLSGGARSRLARTVDPQLVEDKFHDVVVTVLSAIHGGGLREPERLMGFVKTITQRRAAEHVRSQISRRRLVPLDSVLSPVSCELDPEAALANHQQSLAIRQVLGRLKARDREILVRFYLHEQDHAHICREMGLTATQFRLYKSRALVQCLALSQRKRPVKALSRSELRIA
jgi:RNA polymerase sigma-70 factor, ECF subfamily